MAVLTKDATQTTQERVQALGDGALQRLARGLLGRKGCEQVLHKAHGHRPSELKTWSAAAIDAAISELWQGAQAKRLIQAFDGATKRERSLVASLAADEIESRLQEHRIMTLRRHGAKLLWAIVRDSRDIGPKALAALYATYVDHMQRLDSARDEALAKGATQAVGELESLYEDAAERASTLEQEISKVQRERHRLSDALSATEEELRQESARRAGLLREVERLKKEVADGPSTQEPDRGDANQWRTKAMKAQASLSHLKTKLEELGALAEECASLRDENQRLRKTLERLREMRAKEQERQEDAQANSAKDADPKRSKPVVATPESARPKGTGKKNRKAWAFFVDVANLSGAARRLYGRSVDFRRLREWLMQEHALRHCHAYAIAKEDSFHKFARSLEDGGYRVFAKKPREFDDGSVKADWDVALSLDAMDIADGLEGFVLGSGDGDYVPLLKRLRARGIAVEVVAFEERLAEILRLAADKVHVLDEEILE